jgi:hypothetical protein
VVDFTGALLIGLAWITVKHIGSVAGNPVPGLNGFRV